MTVPHAEGGARPTPAVDAGRLWAGGLATALVAALVVVVGILIARGIFGVPVLAPEGDGAWGDADTVTYALFAALAALLATALMHLLLLFAPRPSAFFGWIITLATLLGMAGPFATEAALAAQVATAAINLVLGVAIGSLVLSAARSAVRFAMLRRGEDLPPYPEVAP
jgi:Family of unknown function (DUF6069)